MSLKYNCPLCGFEIISDFLVKGDLYRCPSCGNKIFVPDNAIETEETPNLPKEPIASLNDEDAKIVERVPAVDDDLHEKEIVKTIDEHGKYHLTSVYPAGSAILDKDDVKIERKLKSKKGNIDVVKYQDVFISLEK